MKFLISSILILLIAFSAEAKLKVLIVDGQNNHLVWPKSTIMMKQYLEETGMFQVDVNRSFYTWKAEREQAFLSLAKAGKTQNLENPKTDPNFTPDFKKYDVVISNFGWKAADWPEATQKALEDYMKAGGGFVSVHAADNSFPDWKEYNRMIGLGGWGDRSEKDGPYVYYSNEGELVRDNSPGGSGAHGPQHVIPITVRVPDHPITAGMPKVWLTAQDECYAKLRGPAENMIVLATGKDLSGKAPTDRHEPILMVVEYGKGRIFHTTLGHDDYSCEGVGFIVSFLRGVEWAATGKVTQPIPSDFPTEKESTMRKFELKGEAYTKVKSNDWKHLLDPDLSMWEVWTGVPHETVKNLPATYKKPENTKPELPIGLGDPMGIYKVTTDEAGELILNISGEVFAGLTSKADYSNYHFTMLFKWGEKKYEPRLDQKRDCGLLYHCYGEHGAFWNVWKRCLELQVQETDMGDLYCLSGTKANVSVNDSNLWDPTGKVQSKPAKRSVDNESPHGEWTRIDLYVIGDKAIHVVNGKVVLALKDATDHLGKSLKSGQIQIQSEAAESYAKDICIRPIKKFPNEILKASGL